MMGIDDNDEETASDDNDNDDNDKDFEVLNEEHEEANIDEVSHCANNFRFEKSKRGIILRILREIFEIQKTNRQIMPRTMSKLDDDWSINTPPRKHTPKRQKIDTDIKIKRKSRYKRLCFSDTIKVDLNP